MAVEVVAVGRPDAVDEPDARVAHAHVGRPEPRGHPGEQRRWRRGAARRRPRRTSRSSAARARPASLSWLPGTTITSAPRSSRAPIARSTGSATSIALRRARPRAARPRRRAAPAGRRPRARRAAPAAARGGAARPAAGGRRGGGRRRRAFARGGVSWRPPWADRPDNLT